MSNTCTGYGVIDCSNTIPPDASYCGECLKAQAIAASVDRSEVYETKHAQEYTLVAPCDRCHVSFPEPELEAHRAVCPDRPHLRVRITADVDGWDVDECEGSTHREMFQNYARELRTDAARRQELVDRLLELADYVDRLAEVQEP